MTPALDHLTAALYFADCAKRARNETERAWFAQVAMSYRMLAVEDGRRFARELPKRPPAASVERAVKRRRSAKPVRARRGA